MIDKNYLGHDFVLINYFDTHYNKIYTCSKCNCEVAYYPSLNQYKVKGTLSHYFFYNVISCDEMIIKNIIE